ncbi:unnamed protein product [Lactuca virosa]|uniref:PGG domain-containing protein n=1 Tax=Lactuca virosa TaxID=75947 RepID=A0AAU9NTM1_9ASTR|nr:unnamed protein product [Lactuca virosa]
MISLRRAMNRSLIEAAWNRDVNELLKRIENNPFMIHALAWEGSETPLHVACFAGHVNFVSTIINLRQDFSRELNQDGKDRKIPLRLVVVKGKVEVVRELLLASLDSVDCMTARFETSLQLAVKNNQFEAFQVLIQHLKQVNKEDLLNSKDIHDNTALHLFVSMKQYEEKIELNSLNYRGLTPLDMLLMFQSEAGDREIMEILVQAGALNNQHSRRGEESSERFTYWDWFTCCVLYMLVSAVVIGLVPCSQLDPDTLSPLLLLVME